MQAHATTDTTATSYDFENHRWWYAQTKTDKETQETTLTDKIVIDILAYLDWLYYCGFRYTKINDNGILFRIKNSKILHEIELSEISQFITKTIQDMPNEIPISDKYGYIEATISKRRLLEKIIQGLGYFADKRKFDAYLGPRESFTMCTDGPTHKYIYFQNGYLHINARGIEFCDYKELPGYIWASEIVAHDYVQPDKQTRYVERFFYLVANGKDPDYTKMEAKAAAHEKQLRATRFANLCAIAGYLAHGYTNYELKAVILTDSRISDANEPNGRSGKSLFMKLVASITCPDVTQPRQKTYVEIDGKDFDQANDKFKFQQASHETRLMFLNDVKRSFKFESFFNYITDGQDIEKKGKESIRVKVKWAIATNLSIELAGDSSKARACVFEFTDYFNAAHSPQDEFKHWFFRDWDAAEYMRMYYFLARCCQAFFADGCKLPKPEIINYQRRTLLEHTSRDFIEYIEEVWQPECNGIKYCLQDKYHQFMDLYPDWKQKKLLQARFTAWVQKYINLSSKYAPYNKGLHSTRNSEGRTFIEFQAAGVKE